MNQSYVQTEQKYKERHNLPPTSTISKKALPPDFPIEHARLRHIGWVTILFIISTSLYGFSVSFPNLVSKPGWIAVPLFLQFFIAATSNAVFAVNQTLISDLCPGRGASSTAINNLVRCSLGAVGVAFIEQMIAGVGVGATFLGLGLFTAGMLPLSAIHWYWGAEWRRQRLERQALREKTSGY